MGSVCCYASDKVRLIIPNKLNFFLFSIIIDDSSDLNFIHGFKFQYAPREGRKIDTGHRHSCRFFTIREMNSYYIYFFPKKGLTSCQLSWGRSLYLSTKKDHSLQKKQMIRLELLPSLYGIIGVSKGLNPPRHPNRACGSPAHGSPVCSFLIGITYAKRPFAGSEQVLEYLGRYTHRVAISNNRIKSIDNGQVCFEYRDRTDNDTTKTMTIMSLGLHSPSG